MISISLQRLPRLTREDRGTSLVEMALIMPFLTLLIVGIIDVSMGLAARFSLQQAVGRSLELVQARPPQAGADDADVSYEYIRTEAANAAGAGSAVTLTRWRECDGAKRDDYKASCADGEETARYIRINIKKNFNGSLYLGNIPMEAEGTVRVQ